MDLGGQRGENAGEDENALTWSRVNKGKVGVMWMLLRDLLPLSVSLPPWLCPPSLSVFLSLCAPPHRPPAKLPWLSAGLDIVLCFFICMFFPSDPEICIQDLYVLINRQIRGTDKLLQWIVACVRWEY